MNPAAGSDGGGWRGSPAAPLALLLLALATVFLFAGVPHQWHVNNRLEDYEGYYASVIYSCFAAFEVERAA